MNENETAKTICDAAIEVHRVLGGAGLLESVYEEALAEELLQRNYHTERQLPVPLFYKGKRLATALRIDLLVNHCVIVECKATTQYNPVFDSQLLTYLRLTNHKLGLIINFGERYVSKGIHRVVNGLN